MQNGAKVVYPKYAGTEVKFNGEKHLILKEDDIVCILETDNVKDMKPLNDGILIKVSFMFSPLCLLNCECVDSSVLGILDRFIYEYHYIDLCQFFVKIVMYKLISFYL